MSLKQILDKTTAFFKQKDIPTSRLDAELLLSFALNLKRIDLYVNFERPMSEEDLQKCRELVRRRGQGEPVAYILGEKEFYGLNFQVGPGVLVPRPETEHLVDAVLDWVKENNYQDKALKVVDMGCGSGCLVTALLHKLPMATAVAVDFTDPAIEFTSKNAEINNVNDRLQVKKLDLNKQSIGDISADIVIANPPYIDFDDKQVQASVVEFEPKQALFAEDNGLFSVKRWFQQAEEIVGKPKEKPADKSLIIFEFGSEQKSQLVNYFNNNWPKLHPQFKKDYAGLDRYFSVEV